MDQLLNEGKSQSCAALSDSIARLVKGLKDHVLFMICDATAGIGDGNTQPCVLSRVEGLRFEYDGLIFRCEFESIAQQVNANLVELVLIEHIQRIVQLYIAD